MAAHDAILDGELVMLDSRAPYHLGRRSDAWQKTKCILRQEFNREV